jgi:(p)ppGpp synthase/HD superfamily hydrolase
MIIPNPGLIERARSFAIAAHLAVGQKRKYSGDPYWRHPRNVAGLLERAGMPPEVVAAGWLHDTVEDTAITISDLCHHFGVKVGLYVCQVTDVSKPSDGNRAARKAIDCDHLSRSTYEGASIKLADIADNTLSIVVNDPDFARVYLREKRDVLAVLYHGEQGLFEMASEVVENGIKSLGMKP